MKVDPYFIVAENMKEVEGDKARRSFIYNEAIPLTDEDKYYSNDR